MALLLNVRREILTFYAEISNLSVLGIRVVFLGGGRFSPSLLYDIPGTGWSVAIPGKDTIYPMHSIYASNYPPTA